MRTTRSMIKRLRVGSRLYTVKGYRLRDYHRSSARLVKEITGAGKTFQRNINKDWRARFINRQIIKDFYEITEGQYQAKRNRDIVTSTLDRLDYENRGERATGKRAIEGRESRLSSIMWRLGWARSRQEAINLCKSGMISLEPGGIVLEDRKVELGMTITYKIRAEGKEVFKKLIRGYMIMARVNQQYMPEAQEKGTEIIESMTPINLSDIQTIKENRESVNIMKKDFEIALKELEDIETEGEETQEGEIETKTLEIKTEVEEESSNTIRSFLEALKTEATTELADTSDMSVEWELDELSGSLGLKNVGLENLLGDKVWIRSMIKPSSTGIELVAIMMGKPRVEEIRLPINLDRNNT